MGSPDSTLSHLVACKVSYGCTDLTAAWPHGGTGLGLTSSIYLKVPGAYAPILREEDNAPDRVIYLGGPLVLGGRLENWDNDVLANVFPSSTTVNGDRVLQWPGSGTQPGGAISPLSKLVVTPEDPTKPGVIIYSAVPLVQNAEEIRLSAKSFLFVPVVFLAIPDSNGRLGCMGKFSRLSGLLT